MNKLKTTLENVINPKNYDKFLNVNSGSDFEDRVESELKRNGFSKNMKTDINPKYLKELKSNDLMKSVSLNPKYEYLNDTFIMQPNGSQNFPDAYIFENNKVYYIEIKFSKKNSKPMWNSNIPKQNGIYIFANNKKRDITMFKGSDVISKDLELKFNTFEKKFKELEKELNASLSQTKNDYGFQYYSRKAYTQVKCNDNICLNFFENNNRNTLEKNVLEFIK